MQSSWDTAAPVCNVVQTCKLQHQGVSAIIYVPIDLFSPEQFLENTIAAFNYACSKASHSHGPITLGLIFAINLQGADMIELDVQLSSDKVPIIYHDFFVRTFLHDVSICE